jgi:hypothetical protein
VAKNKRKFSRKTGKKHPKKKVSMIGSVAYGYHEGSRSEIIADYVLASWGTVTPVRRPDDHGHDLYCSMTDHIGQRAIVSDYYAVQVKSTQDPLIYSPRRAVEWLIKNPNPLFLTCVDKKRGVISIYQTLVRLFVAIRSLPSRLTLTVEEPDEGRCPSGLSSGRSLSLSAPILKIELSDLLVAKRMEMFRKVLKHWIGIDRRNLNLRAAGLLRFQMPYQYRTNEVPTAGPVQHDNFRPDGQQMREALETIVETLDCVGYQLFARKDRKAALHAAALLRHLRANHAPELPKRWRLPAGTNLESNVRAHFNEGLRDTDRNWLEPSEVIDRELRGNARIKSFLKSS